MIEATNIKTIEEMIDSLESEKFRLPANAKPTEPTLQEEPVIEPKNEPETIIHQDQGVTPEILFARLCERLMDRNVDLGECFKAHIRYVSFEDGELSLSSSAEGDASKTLNTYYSIIKHFIQELFGLETKIKISKVQAEPKPLEEMTAPTSVFTSDESFQAPLYEEEQSASTIESLEFGETLSSESCATGAMLAGQRELEAKEILNTPFVQRATELFDPQKIQIRQKV